MGKPHRGDPKGNFSPKGDGKVGQPKGQAKGKNPSSSTAQASDASYLACFGKRSCGYKWNPAGADRCVCCSKWLAGPLRASPPRVDRDWPQNKGSGEGKGKGDSNGKGLVKQLEQLASQPGLGALSGIATSAKEVLQARDKQAAATRSVAVQLTEAWAQLRRKQKARQNEVDHRDRLDKEIQERKAKHSKAEEDIAAADVEIAAFQADIDTLQKQEKAARPQGPKEEQQTDEDAPTSISNLGSLAEQLGKLSPDNRQAQELQEKCQAITVQWGGFAKTLAEVACQCKTLLEQTTKTEATSAAAASAEELPEASETMEVDAQWTTEEIAILQMAVPSATGAEEQKPNQVQFDAAFKLMERKRKQFREGPYQRRS